MFQFLITISPLGFLYASAGAFLSPENLVGRSGAKFPPDASTLAGLFFSANKSLAFAKQEELRHDLFVAGPFWAQRDDPEAFNVPIPRHRIVGEHDEDEWHIEDYQWTRDKTELKADYFWQSIDAWKRPLRALRRNGEAVKPPWHYVSFLHPKIKPDERHVVDQDGLFLENAVQMDEDTCLVYLATYSLPDGWYRLGGEGHMVEVESLPIEPGSNLYELLHQPISRSCALITPGVWGSNNLSYRYPKATDFPKQGLKLLTDKAIPYRYRAAGRMGRGRYAVPAGSVYVFKKPLDKTWWEFPEEWFPKEGFPLKHLGCGLCLPVDIQGVA
jgi:CRISPR-associated protein Cmr3